MPYGVAWQILQVTCALVLLTAHCFLKVGGLGALEAILWYELITREENISQFMRFWQGKYTKAR